jgi:hypothetical protein
MGPLGVLAWPTWTILSVVILCQLQMLTDRSADGVCVRTAFALAGSLSVFLCVLFNAVLLSYAYLSVFRGPISTSDRDEYAQFSAYAVVAGYVCAMAADRVARCMPSCTRKGRQERAALALTQMDAKTRRPAATPSIPAGVLVDVVEASLHSIETWAPDWKTMRRSDAFAASLSLGVQATACTLASSMQSTVDRDESDLLGARLRLLGITVAVLVGGSFVTYGTQYLIERYVTNAVLAYAKETADGRVRGAVLHLRNNLIRTGAVLATIGASAEACFHFDESNVHAPGNWTWMYWPIVFCVPSAIILVALVYFARAPGAGAPSLVGQRGNG